MEALVAEGFPDDRIGRVGHLKICGGHGEIH